MHIIKYARQRDAAQKYDIITALGAYALARGKHDQRLVLRLITLVTARYNWARDELAVGQREIARLWTVDERTVKREMAKLRGLGWLVVKRQGARGRVTEYGFNIDRILETTQENWCNVGPDFDLRMTGQPETTEVVSLPVKGTLQPPDTSSGTEWALAQAILYTEAPDKYASWLRNLARVGRAGGRLTLKAPSRFHCNYVQTHLVKHVLLACQAVDPDVTDIALVV
ncbi:DnaA N-terminal domain-containing protein [Yoonia sp.]|uniref:DnaA N-terminal domain-containing protein n=1 Tax=Yoonia sp. TaxID=2212373 RepID=UPI003A4D3B37